MAANMLTVSQEQALTTVDLTIIQILAPSNINVRIHSVLWTFQGTSNTAAPVVCTAVRQTSAGSGGAALVAYPLDERDAATPQATCLGGTFSGEPTEDGTPKIVASRIIHPQSGMYLPFLLNGPIIIKGGSRIGFKANPAAGVDCMVEVMFEE